MVNNGGHAIDTLTGLLIDLVASFHFLNIILMDLYISDWKVTSRHTKFRRIQIQENRNKLSWKVLRLNQDFRKISSELIST